MEHKASDNNFFKYFAYKFNVDLTVIFNYMPSYSSKKVSYVIKTLGNRRNL